MTLKPKPEFDYKPAFKLALLSNAIVLSIGALLLSKSRVESVPTFRQQQGSDRYAKPELYMKPGDGVTILCQQRDGKPGRPIIYNEQGTHTLWCTNVYSGT